jgi:hypothetical protein
MPAGRAHDDVAGARERLPANPGKSPRYAAHKTITSRPRIVGREACPDNGVTQPSCRSSRRPSSFDEICQATHQHAFGQRPLFMHECAFGDRSTAPDRPVLRVPGMTATLASSRAYRRLGALGCDHRSWLAFSRRPSVGLLRGALRSRAGDSAGNRTAGDMFWRASCQTLSLYESRRL